MYLVILFVVGGGGMWIGIWRVGIDSTNNRLRNELDIQKHCVNMTEYSYDKCAKKYNSDNSGWYALIVICPIIACIFVLVIECQIEMNNVSSTSTPRIIHVSQITPTIPQLERRIQLPPTISQLNTQG